MNIIPASEVKRRGVIALLELTKSGPVHIIKNNHPACVVLSEKEYARLTRMANNTNKEKTLLSSMLEKPATGNKTKRAIDWALEEERNAWKDK